MIDILLKTLPFFAILGLGYGAAKSGFFSQSGTAYLTKFVFYFALPAMIFRFAAGLPLAEVFQGPTVLAYLAGTAAVYSLATAGAVFRGVGVEEAAIEAQSAAIGNVGFLGIPLLLRLLGPEAIGPLMVVLATDLIVFGSLIVVIVSARRSGHFSLRVLVPVGIGLLKNPMVMAMALGIIWAWRAFAVPAPMDEFLTLLGAAATPGALFAIGASLAPKSAERLSVALWLSSAKLALHPALVALMALLVFNVPPYAAAVLIATAAMPTAGNVYILAQHYGIAPARVSSTILLSTMASIISVTLIIALVSPHG